MIDKRPRGLFVVGTDTGVGKSYVAAAMARALRQAGRRVGVYKPAASGCREVAGSLESDDAVALWEAAGRPGTLDEVCPQRFRAPLAPHLAARAEGRTLDAALLRRGVEPWQARSEIVIVEGAGGLLSPLGDDEYVADLALDLQYPLVVVGANRLGTIHATLSTLVVAATWARPERLDQSLQVAAVVLSRPTMDPGDASVPSNVAEVRARAHAELVVSLDHGATEFDPPVDWWELAGRPVE